MQVKVKCDLYVFLLLNAATCGTWNITDCKSLAHDLYPMSANELEVSDLWLLDCANKTKCAPVLFGFQHRNKEPVKI